MQRMLGEVIAFAGNFAPRGWELCEGQLLPISQNPALYSILGTHYGGDGRVTFGLPDLQGRTIIGTGEGLGLRNYRSLGDKGGEETVTLTIKELPTHSHTAYMHAEKGLATEVDPKGRYLAKPADGSAIYADSKTADDVQMAPGTVGVDNAGAGLPHDNMQPFTALTYIISTQGTFPARKA